MSSSIITFNHIIRFQEPGAFSSSNGSSSCQTQQTMAFGIRTQESTFVKKLQGSSNDEYKTSSVFEELYNNAERFLDEEGLSLTTPPSTISRKRERPTINLCQIPTLALRRVLPSQNREERSKLEVPRKGLLARRFMSDENSQSIQPLNSL